jgi:hypothetical protein
MTPDLILVDEGNPLLAPSTCRLDTGTVDHPQGTLGVATFRTTTTTLTLMLLPDALSQMVDLLTSLRDELRGSKIERVSPVDLAKIAENLQAFKNGGNPR